MLPVTGLRCEFGLASKLDSRVELRFLTKSKGLVVLMRSTIGAASALSAKMSQSQRGMSAKA